MLNVSSFAAQKSPFATVSKDSSTLSVPSLSMASSTSAATTAASTTTASSLDALATQGSSIINSTAVKILQKPPFAPSNVNMFSPQLYSAASPMAPAAANSKTEAQIKTDLKATFSARFCGNTTKINQGMAVYDNAQIKALVPDPRLRSAIASLYGTDAEATITSLKNGDFKGVEFADLPVGMNPNNVAFSGTKVGDTKPTIVFNNKYKYEDPRLLGVVAAHESLHSDTQNSDKEELVAAALESSIYAQYIKEDPSLASKNTELTRRSNTRLMALVNSRDAQGKIRLLTAQGNVYPGGTTPLANFGAAFPGAATAASTSGNAALNSMISKSTGQATTGANFDANTINLLDQKLTNTFSSPEWVAIAAILKLKVV